MANSRTPNVSPAAHDSMVRRRLREATAAAAPPEPPMDGPESPADDAQFDSGLAWNADEALRREMERLESNRQFTVGNRLPSAGGDPFAVASPAMSELDPLGAAGPVA